MDHVVIMFFLDNDKNDVIFAKNFLPYKDLVKIFCELGSQDLPLCAPLVPSSASAVLCEFFTGCPLANFSNNSMAGA